MIRLGFLPGVPAGAAAVFFLRTARTGTCARTPKVTLVIALVNPTPQTLKLKP